MSSRSSRQALSFTLAAALAFVMPACAAGRPLVTWTVERRELGFSGWRQRLVPDGHGGAWIGGEAAPGSSEAKLFRLTRAGEVVAQEMPAAASRTFVLDVDPAGTLWLCACSTNAESNYRSLRLRRWDGRSWSEEPVVPGIWPQAIDMVSPREGWIGGNHATLLHYTGGGWHREVLDLSPAARRHRNILALQMRGSGDGWAVGVRGLVARYRAGRWHVVPVPPAVRSETLFGLDVSADGALWVVGTKGLIARYAGGVWRVFPAPTSFFLTDVEMVAPDDGWAVGAFGTILRYDGRAWRPQFSPTVAHLSDVAMVSAGEGWIAGDGVVLRATAGRRFLLRDVSRLGGYPMARQPGRGTAAVDVDGDGDLDLSSWYDTSASLFENRGGEGFIEVALPALPVQGVPSVRGATWGDAEGDGDLDLVVLAENPAGVWLYRNRGGLRFAAPERIAAEPIGADDSAAFLDLDGDGDLDLYLLRSALPGPRSAGNPVLENDGAGRFTRRDAATGGTGGTGGKGIEMLALWGDLDGDGDLDAVLPAGTGLELLQNDGGRLRAAGGSGLALPPGDGPVRQGHLLDLDRDGDLDLLLLGDRLHVFRNLLEARGAGGRIRFRREDGLFDPVTHNAVSASRLTAAGDLDDDGYPEVLLQPVTAAGPTARLFSRGADGRYHDVAVQAGVADLRGSGAVFADWDGDGDLDLFLAGDTGSTLLENRRGGAAALGVRLHGVLGNRPAIGARVRIWEAGRLGAPDALRGFGQAGAGAGPTGLPDPSGLHFGLEPGRSYDLEAIFAGGRRVVERGISPGRVLDVYESPAGLRPFYLGWRWARRACRAADPWRETVKLALAALALAFWRGPLARRLGARLLLPRPSLAVVLGGAYLLAAGALAADGRARVHAGHLVGFMGALGLIAAGDRRLSRWRSARHQGPYRLLEPLGEGGMGVVYRARHMVTGRTVALKVLHPRLTERDEHRGRLLREAGILLRLEHPNIVKIYETGSATPGESGGCGYIAMELLPGMSLRRFVERHGAVAPAAAHAMLESACAALAYVHERGIVHRDVKSDNLFLPDDEAALRAGDPEAWRRVKLMDFGLARSAGLRTSAGQRALAGTLAYLPPEQLRGQEPDSRADLYSLGVAAYEALAGRLPFVAADAGALLARIQAGAPAPLHELCPGIPAGLARLIERMLARDPGQRPASALTVGAALAALAGGREEAFVAPSPAASSPSWKGCFEEACRRLEEERTTEAQILLVECLAGLRQALLPLAPDAQDAYCRQYDVGAVIDLSRRLNP